MKLILAHLIIASAYFTTISQAVDKPNSVFIMVDDLGPGWVDYEGTNPTINTPNLQRMAEAGMIFTRAYAAASVCSPTRAACITGMSPAQMGLTTHIPGAPGRRHPASKGGPKDAESINQLPLKMPSYARELKKLGYATAFIGKWHLAGEGSIRTDDGIVDMRFHPEHFGFDSNLGGCAYGQPKSWFDPFRNGTIKDSSAGQYLTERLADGAVTFINTHKEEPFHLTLWPYSVHKPFKAPKEIYNKNGKDHYRGMLESMDIAVGRVLDALEANGLSENTLVVFYSDNGGEKPTEGLSEIKGSLLEGGIRVPMVVTWPGVIGSGSTSAEPVTSMDFFPTFVHMAGGTTENIDGLEGMDLMPLFEGESQLDRESIYWHYPHNRKGIKYDMGGVVMSREWKFYNGYGIQPDALFNLKDDPSEVSNLNAAHPERATDMLNKHEAWLEKISAAKPDYSELVE